MLETSGKTGEAGNVTLAREYIESAMETTLNLNDQILRQAKGRAAHDGITLTRFVEDALRARLEIASERNTPFRLRLKTVTGDRPPNVDISDRDALYDVIDHDRG